MAFTVLQAGPEILVNTTTVADQENASITKLAGGGWVVTWQSENQDGSGSDIFQQRYNADGSRNGGETKVNSWTANDQTAPSIAAFSDGGWVVTWTSFGQHTGTEYETSTSVYQQRFNADGTPNGAETRINTTLTNNQQAPSVASRIGNGWVVTWESVDQDGSGTGIYQQLFSANGLRLGGEVRVNTTTTNHQKAPSVTSLPDGGWLVTWQSLNQDGSGYDIYQQRFGSFGNPSGPETRVNTAFGEHEMNPSVTVLNDGGWVVTWQSSNMAGTEFGIYQQRYSPDGSAVGIAVRVNASTAEYQDSPSVTALADGGWLVAWGSNKAWPDSLDIHQQRFKADGSAAGAETIVHTLTQEHQFLPSVTGLEDGSWVVSWNSATTNGTYNYDVYQRRFKATDTEVLTSAIEVATGTAAAETLSVNIGGLNAGDVIDARGGRDILAMNAAGTLDLTAPDTLKGFEVVRGSGGNDTIVANVERLAGFDFLDGYEGVNVLRLVGGADGATFDLRNRAIANFDAIELADTSGTSIILTDKAIALSVRGMTGTNDTLKLSGGTFSVEQRTQLFNQGIETVEDSSGVYNAPPPNQPPTIISPATLMIQELAGNGTPLGSIFASDPNGDQLFYELINTAEGRFKLAGNQVLVDDGFKLDHEQAASHTVTVRVRDAAGHAVDKNITIDIGDWRGESTAGTAGNDVFKGGYGNDRLSGNAGNDRLFGGVGNDILRGEAGNDIVGGGEGRDQLYGLRGSGSRDAFLFDTRLTSKTVANRHKDVINDFGSRYDSIYLDDAAFGNATIARFLRGKGASLDTPVKMQSGFFKVGARAEDRDDYFIFNRSNKKLYWDADGSGRKAMVEIATLKLQSGEGTTLTYHDFYFV